MTAAQSLASNVLSARQPKNGLRWLAVALAALGWWLSLQLVPTPDRAASPLIDALCGGAQAKAGWNCQAVLNSPAAYVRLSPQEGALRIPVSTLGMGYFAAVALWYLIVGPPGHARRLAHLPILAFVLIGCLASLSFIYTMAYEVRQWCVVCLVVHALNLVLLLLTVVTWPWRKPTAESPITPAQSPSASEGQPAPDAPPRPAHLGTPHPSARLLTAGVIAVVLVLFSHVAGALTIVLGGQVQRVTEMYRKLTDDPAYVKWNLARQPLVDLAVRPGEPMLGDPEAPHTVVIFSDFQCAACRKAHEVLADMVRKHPNLRVVFRYFPQDPSCNPTKEYQSGGGHVAACAAARACEAAFMAGGADAANAMRSLLYARQNELERQEFERYAGELKLDVAAYKTALGSGAVRDRVQADVELGMKLGLTGLPVLYFDGRPMAGWSNPKIWGALLGDKSAEPTTRPGAGDANTGHAQPFSTAPAGVPE